MMKLFSKENLLRLKQDIDLVFVVGSTVKLLQKGQRFFGSCPFHNDSSQALVVSAKKNLWFCYGACKKGGSIVDWLVCLEKVSVGGALSLLAQHYPFLAGRGQLVEQGLNKALPKEEVVSQHQSLLLQVVEDYSLGLHKHKKAVRYLRSLGISYPAFRDFKIGYSEGLLAQTLAESPNDHSILVKELVELGILTRVGGAIKEHFHGLITFPCFDEQGKCVQLYARAVPKDFRDTHIQLLAG